MGAQALEVADVDSWRTQEMALVAFLSLQGIEHMNMERNGRSCFWYFEESDELHDKVDEYLQGDGLVEPRAFNDTFARIKRDMFAFLNNA